MAMLVLDLPRVVQILLRLTPQMKPVEARTIVLVASWAKKIPPRIRLCSRKWVLA